MSNPYEFGTTVFADEGFVIKYYTVIPCIEDVQHYYSLLRKEDILADLLMVKGNKAIFEYVNGYDGNFAYDNGENIYKTVCDIIDNIVISCDDHNCEKLTNYEKRRKHIYGECLRKIEAYLAADSNSHSYFMNQIVDLYCLTGKYWKIYFTSAKNYIIHGDLHPGNIIFDEKRKEWRIIDPIVTIAPIEFEYVRFIENMAYKFWQSSEYEANRNGILETAIVQIIELIVDIKPNLNRFYLLVALFIDSYLRLVETIVDTQIIKVLDEGINLSLIFCKTVGEMVEQCVKVDGEGWQ